MARLYQRVVAGALIDVNDDETITVHVGPAEWHIAAATGALDVIDAIGSAVTFQAVRSGSPPVGRADGVEMYLLLGGTMCCTGWPEGGGPLHPAEWLMWAPGTVWDGDAACSDPIHQDHAALRAQVPGLER
jgi:hypothetical protein